MSTMSLYNITGRFYELMARAAADETLTPAELEEQYQELTQLLQQKTPGVVGYYRNVEAGITAVENEIKRLMDLAYRAKKHRDNYKQYVKECMERLDIIELSTDFGKLRISKNPLSVNVDNIEAVPDEFVESTLTIKGSRNRVQLLLELFESDIELMDLKVAITDLVDKRAVTEHFKQTGEVVDGIAMQVDSTRLEFK